MALTRKQGWEPVGDGPPAELPRPPLSYHLQLLLVVAVLGAVHVWAWRGVEMDLGLILNSLPHMADFLSRMVPPDWSVVRTVTGAVVETLQIAIIGTTAGVVLALPLGFLAAGNVAHPLVRGVVRTLLNGIRSVPLILYALFFVAAVGLGPLAGTLATALYSVGMLGKFFSEAIEAIDPKPVEGVLATGAGRLQALRFGVLPQVFPLFMAYILYRFELNVREGAILGLVGAGGIGFYITLYMRSFEYGRVATLTLIILVMVAAIDALSSYLRAKLT
jgi:phosphonate transport system permease protein